MVIKASAGCSVPLRTWQTRAGIWANPVPLNPAAWFSGDTPGNLVFTENLIGPTMRIRIVSETLPFPTIPDLKVAVYLKR